MRSTALASTICVSTLLTSVAGLALATLGGCADQAGTAQRHDITAQQLQTMMADGDAIVLIDVRTAEEFAAGHIAGTVNRPVEDIETWWSTLTPAARTVCICKGGVRSRTAADTLIGKGFTDVYNMLGGMDNWPGATVTGAE